MADRYKYARFHPFCVNPKKGNYVVFDRSKNKSHSKGELGPDGKVLEPYTHPQAIEAADVLNGKHKSGSLFK